MKVHEVIACSFPAWYHKFRKVTIRSRILTLPPSVLAYLRSNSGVVLPAECAAEQRDGRDEDYEGDADGGGGDWTEADEEAPPPPPPTMQQPTFPDFSLNVRDTIEELGGKVFCKLNWSCPRDAAWMSSLECTTISQVYLLLKSSDFVAHDLTQPFKDCDDVETADDAEPYDENKCCAATSAVSPYSLVLRRWTEINPAHEFRCFVKRKRVVAVSQRDNSNFYTHIADDAQSIQRDILSFFDEFVREKFPLDDYVLDVVRRSKDHVELVDFNPFGPTTDGLLFDWHELLEIDDDGGGTKPDFRFITSDAGIQPNSYKCYSVPRDILDITSGTDPDKLTDFLQLQTKQAS